MYRAQAVHPQQWVSDGVSNKEGDLIAAVTEIVLSPGIWEVSALRIHQLQVNMTPGEGMGTNPVTMFGQVSPTAVSLDAQWYSISVPVGEVRYLVIRKYPGEPDGIFFVNKNSGPALSRLR